ncbi:hypothetical protein BpHYR1_048680 [Brachionus plicatilis]|uniref:SAM domain-containing protein n=1 Tax=Brachionus plicatilis TaxID=10195 RepID=A0A3M7S4S0_BRAPC|nr:hypothetical protein BpHYR1_048680 [Brachionus plicatilis]
MQSSSDFSTWSQFFSNAQIPQQFVNSYASKFCENRIRFDMLADIDKVLLNEMGITAIGDCLSILKHAKVIITKLEEEKKEAFSRETPKKRGEVAKRIIENCLGDTESKQEKSSSNLSQDLISRLNFTKSPVVKFNEESLGKVVVSSTTDDLDYGDKTKNLKRKLNDDVENTVKEKPLEYRGLLKNTSHNGTQVKPASLNDALKKKKTESKVICLSKKEVNGMEKAGDVVQAETKKIVSLKYIKQSSELEKDKQNSVFSRIKPLAKSSSAAAAVRLLKEAVQTKNHEQKIIPISSEFKNERSTQGPKIVKLNQSQRLNKSVHDRLSFK